MKAEQTGTLLDVGCRDRKEDNWTGIDTRKRPGVDIVHNLEKFPYPIKTSSVFTIKAAHIAEHIPPNLILKWFDEMWRMLKPGGQMALATPYAGSQAYWNDPTHVTGFTEVSFQMLDPNYPLYHQYEPKPWKVEHSVWKPQGNLEIILRKIDTDYCFLLTMESLKKMAMQKVSELHSLYALLKGMDLSVVVEIGSAHGGVFYGLCQVARSNATLVSIDLPGGKFGGEAVPMDESILRAYGRKGQNIHLIRRDSHLKSTLDELKQVLKGRKIDFLLIDGDHTYEGAKQDYMTYSPLVRKGGAIALHDICTHPFVPECKVDKFWGEVKKGKKHIEMIDHDIQSWGGIGVVLP